MLERGSLQARAHFVLKTDDDSFVYMWQLLRELRAAPRRGFFWGYNIGDFKPNRDSKARSASFVHPAFTALRKCMTGARASTLPRSVPRLTVG